MKHRFHIFWIIVIVLVFGYCSSAKAQWRKLIRGSVILYCHDNDIQYGENILYIIEENVTRVAEDLGLAAVGEIKIIIASSEQEFNTLTGQQIPEWGVAATDPQMSAIYLKSPYLSRAETDLEKVIVHELSHVIMGMVLEGKSIDRWFDEGFAQYEAGEQGVRGTILLARSLVTGNIIWLNEVDDVLTFQRQKAALAYQVSYMAVQYLVDTYGKDMVVNIIQSLRDGKEMDEALFLSIGIGFQNFQDNWYATMKKKYVYYLFLDFPFLFSLTLLVLFFTALVVTRRRMVKKRRVWELEESYDYEGF
ncbi:hypothetical protein JW824_14640 [bacterium]|nr:hypothetical protein [bacterium]RQV93457.1 MAG: hypothetical protein EH221_09535 [bacterium]